ncbi:MAG: hypothetical protein HUK08_03750, partial [Bacteroidaceae bacterium]|nr:hypothetical protein [Bacteroidaceae bacterium]
MKTNIFILSVAFAALCSCGNSAKTNGSGESADTLQVSNQESSEATDAVNDSTATEDDFVDNRPYDLRTMQVSGPVKRIVTKTTGDNDDDSEYEEAYAFNEDGVIISMRFNKVYAKNIRHNKQGQVDHLIIDNDSPEGQAATEYSWSYNADGTLKKHEEKGMEFGFACYYEYKDYRKGLPYTIIAKEYEETDAIELTYTVEYTSFDENGI